MSVRYSLLDIVQKTLSSMDGDEVNSISDTTESLQVVTNAELVYNDLILNADLPEVYDLYSLTASGSALRPIVMSRPAGYETLEWLKYKRSLSNDTSGKLYWTELKPIGIDEYLTRAQSLSTTSTNVATMSLVLSGATVEIPYYKDRSPDWFATYNDTTVLFNSVDLAVESTLQTSKTLCYGQVSNLFIAVDGFTPTFDSGAHLLWLNETIALCNARMRQIVDQKAEKSARKGWIKLQDMKEAIKLPYYQRYPNYSRK